MAACSVPRAQRNAETATERQELAIPRSRSVADRRCTHTQFLVYGGSQGSSFLQRLNRAAQPSSPQRRSLRPAELISLLAEGDSLVTCMEGETAKAFMAGGRASLSLRAPGSPACAQPSESQVCEMATDTAESTVPDYKGDLRSNASLFIANRGGRGQIKQKKKTVPQKVTIAKIPRAKKKYVTRVCGLATFEIDLKEAQRFFAQKFSCGASVTGEDEIIIQGDFTDDIIDVIQEKWPENPRTDLESSTIQKQRKELQLLIAELKDRDKELNDMVAVHQRQLLAWEDDRQKILTLAERCSRLENELHKRNEMIRTLTQRLKLLESQQNDRRTTLENTQQKLQELSQKATDTTLHCQALEEKNQSLNCSVLELSAKIGQLQAREQELITMLKLKDKDILEATNHITEFTSKFKKLESALRAAKMGESSINKEKQDFKLRLKQLTFEMNKLKDDLSEKTKENNEQREEIIRLKQENNYLKNELVLNDFSWLYFVLHFDFYGENNCFKTVEKANRQDQLLQSAKSKQVRTNTELSNLRQDSCSPTSKLQRLLAESRQMVADLELSTLLHINPCCSPNSSSINMTTELTEALCKAQLPAMEESAKHLQISLTSNGCPAFLNIKPLALELPETDAAGLSPFK
ncbi:Coiled-coil domain-containing protein 62 [Chelonia mydas]|uniref:Density-regulated protein n=1 Tax=Chelonia mydas TaxID=8469 RepID=M7BGP6_CHEMY|nr:Coiled-coil domain-containing protein 62 [Chelonia mydas]